MKVRQKPIYLDYASATPLDPRVCEAMEPYLKGVFGNPGSLHSYGQEASAAVFKARQTVADALGCHYSEIIFTGSATEANNLALRGAVRKWIIDNRKENGKPRIIISAIEHESVLETAKDLEREGVEVVVVPVSKEGVVNVKKIKSALNERTVLVSVMYASNEVGTIQPVQEIARIVRNFRAFLAASSKLQAVSYPLFHVDAVQAFQYVKCDVNELGVDLMTLSSQKIYGPKGVGLLYVRKSSGSKLSTINYPLSTILTGGGQEHELRSGTENVPGIVGFAKAIEIVEMIRITEAGRVGALRDYLYKRIKIIVSSVVVNGSITHQGLSRLPNNLNIYIPRASGEQLLVALDLAGIAVSSGSACQARSIDPSRTILAMGLDRIRAKNSLRFTLGRMTTRREIDETVRVLQSILKTVVKKSS